MVSSHCRAPELAEHLPFTHVPTYVYLTRSENNYGVDFQGSPDNWMTEFIANLLKTGDVHVVFENCDLGGPSHREAEATQAAPAEPPSSPPSGRTAYTAAQAGRHAQAAPDHQAEATPHNHHHQAEAAPDHDQAEATRDHDHRAAADGTVDHDRWCGSDRTGDRAMNRLQRH